MSVATLPGRSVPAVTSSQPRTVLVCVPPGPLVRVFVERMVAAGGARSVRIATTPHQALAGYARQHADVVLVDRNFARDPIDLLGGHRAPQTSVIVIDVGTDGELLATVAGAATGGLRSVRRPPVGPPVRLTGREQQVLHHICDGATNEEIADDLGIGADTVKTHVRRLYEKLGARRRTQAVAVALRSGLID